MASGLNLFTIGHGAVELAVFTQYLRDAAIESFVDVRRFPGSRRHPQFSSASLAAALEASGIAYTHAVDLGGRRRPLADSPNGGLHDEGFRGYADWMLGAPFAQAFSALLEEASSRRTAIACAETLWWRCHRRLIADAAVVLRGANVTHLVSGKEVTHRLTPGVTRDGDRVLYPILSNGPDAPGAWTA